jgi:hypothetical protein
MEFEREKSGQRPLVMRAEGEIPWAPEESEMLELSRFYGIVIKIYYREHGVPHFHAIYAEDAAVYSISDLEVMVGGLPPVARGLVEQWAREHQAELAQAWQDARDGRPPRKIPGLE